MLDRQSRWQHLLETMVFGRALWVLCITVLLVSPPAAQGQENDDLGSVTLHLKWMHAFQFAGYYAAVEQGYYGEEGLDVTIHEASVESQALNTVLSGDAQYGVWGSALLNERLSGKPLVVLAVIFQHSPYVVLSREDSKFRVPSDLIGRKVMVESGMGGVQLRAMFLHEGLSPDAVTIVPATWRIDDIIDGKVDASMDYITDQPDQMRLRGVEPSIMRPIDYGIDFYGDCLFTTEAEIEQHPQRAAAFRRASLKGWEYAMSQSHREEMIEIILKLPGVRERGLTAGHLRYEAEQMENLILPNFIEMGHMNPGRWKHIADTCVGLGMLDPNYSIKGFLYDPAPHVDYRWLSALVGCLVGIVLVAALAWVWNRQLRAAVKERTGELNESEERYRAIAEDTPVLICRFLPDGEIAYVNESYCKYFNMTSDELVGSSFLSLVSEEDREVVMANISTMSVELPNQSHEHRVIAPDGEVRWMRWTSRAQFDPQGQVVTYQSIGEDITRRKQVEAERERLMYAIEQAEETVVITDVEGTIQYVNPAFERITGYNRDEVVGQNPRLLKSDKHEASFYEDMWDTLVCGETWHGQIVNKNKNGSLFTEEATISPVRDVSGKTVNYVAVKRDVTRERALEAQLRQAQKMEAVGQLAGGVAHDFNNLLQVILGYGEIALVEGSGPVIASVEEMIQAGNRAKTLVRQLLAYSRRQVLNMEDVDLNDIVGDLIKMIRRVIGEHIMLDIHAGYDLGVVRADLGQIEQILMNLCVNARDAMPNGGTISIETENVWIDEAFCKSHRWAKPGQHVLLSVTDTGCGMDGETIRKIFEPFFTTKEVGKGSGLGLSTVYGLVKQHQGMVHVYSEVDKGTAFKVYLPVVERSASIEENKVEEEVSGGTETILFAEDDEKVRKMTKTILEGVGYTVLAACDGEEALRVFNEHEGEVDLALLDVMMPHLGGRAVFERICVGRPGLRVLFASGYSMNVIHTNFVLDAGLALIQKPFQRDALLRMVREVLDQ